MTEFVMVRLPRDLSAKVDRARGDVPRERWVRRALERALDDGDKPLAFQNPDRPPARAPYVRPFNPRPKGKS